MPKRALVIGLLVLLCVVAPACGGGERGGTGAARPGVGPTGVANPPFEGAPPDEPFVFQGTPGTYGGTLVFSVISDPKSFNPITSSETSTTAVIVGPVYVPLFGFDNIAQHIDDGLTTSHESTPDGKNWTIKLRKGVRWSDGEPFTADDVKFTYDVAFDKDVDNSIKSSFEQSDKSLPVVEKVDDYTVKFTLKEPNALFLDNVGSTYIIPKHKWEGAWKDKKFMTTLGVDTNPADIVGLGPFRIKEFKAGERILLERNPYYWKVDTKGQRLPYLDRVIMQIVPDLNAMLLNFQNGTTDMHYNVRPEEVDLLKREEAAKGYKVTDLGQSFNVTYICVNQHTGKSATTGKPYVDPVKLAWFRDPKFRQAIAYGVDRAGIVRTVYQGLGGPAYGINTAANKLWYDDNAVVKYTYDVEKGKALLKEIGIEDRDGDGVAEDAKGNKIAFNLTTNTNNPSRVQIATYIKDNLRGLGMDINLQPLPFNTLVGQLQDTHDWEAVVGSWQSANPPDPVLMKNIFLSSGRIHYSFPLQEKPSTEWEARIDELMQKNQVTLELAERQKQFAEVQHLWSEFLPEIDLVAPNYFVAVKDYVANVRPSPLPLYTYWNIEELYLTR